MALTYKGYKYTTKDACFHIIFGDFLRMAFSLAVVSSVAYLLSWLPGRFGVPVFYLCLLGMFVLGLRSFTEPILRRTTLLGRASMIVVVTASFCLVFCFAYFGWHWDSKLKDLVLLVTGLSVVCGLFTLLFGEGPFVQKDSICPECGVVTKMVDSRTIWEYEDRESSPGKIIRSEEPGNAYVYKCPNCLLTREKLFTHSACAGTQTHWRLVERGNSDG